MQNKARVTPVPEIFEGKAFAYRLGLLAFPHFQPCTEDVFAELVSCSSHSNGRAAAGASMAWVPTEPVVVCLLSSALQRDGMRCNGGIDPPKNVTEIFRNVVATRTACLPWGWLPQAATSLNPSAGAAKTRTRSRAWSAATPDAAIVRRMGEGRDGDIGGWSHLTTRF